MKLDYHRPDFAVQSKNRYADCLNRSYALEFPTSTWINLRELLNPFSFDEALLLCQLSEDEWLVWIPDHGEARLHQSLVVDHCSLIQ
jgi:hypothetical protein